MGLPVIKAIPHNSRLTAQAPLRRLRHGICVAKMLDNVGLRYPHRASGAKAPRTLRPLPLLRFAVSATGGAHLCSIQYYLRFWLGICRTSLAVSELRIMRYCLCFLGGSSRSGIIPWSCSYRTTRQKSLPRCCLLSSKIRGTVLLFFRQQPLFLPELQLGLRLLLAF